MWNKLVDLIVCIIVPIPFNLKQCMKSKRIYEIFNMFTGEWEPKEMTEEEFQEIQRSMDSQSDILDAEYKIITKIISQKMGIYEAPKDSMD